MSFSQNDLIHASNIDLDSFSYMEIGKIHRDSLNWETRRSNPSLIGAARITPVNEKSKLGKKMETLKKAS